jgi:radical SAM superfamily enzyme YgiQ (UPF0313 family)
MYYEGKVYRPWMEANSLLILTTLGCTHNKCTFCDMFREKRFRIRKIEEIFKEKYLLENLAGFETIYWGDHANNIVSSRGRLPESQKQFLRKIDHAIASHPVTKQEVLITSP